MRLLILALTVLLLALPAQAASLTMGKPGYGGSGCPGGTASVSLSRDGKSLTLRFTRYAVSAGGATGRTFDRKSCNLAIPVRVPAGKSVSILAIDFAGYNSLPASAKSEFRVEYFLAGGQRTGADARVQRPQAGNLQDLGQAHRQVGGVVRLRRRRHPAHQFEPEGHHLGRPGRIGEHRVAEGEIGDRLHPAIARLLGSSRTSPGTTTSRSGRAPSARHR